MRVLKKVTRLEMGTPTNSLGPKPSPTSHSWQGKRWFECWQYIMQGAKQAKHPSWASRIPVDLSPPLSQEYQSH